MVVLNRKWFPSNIDALSGQGTKRLYLFDFNPHDSSLFRRPAEVSI